MNLKPRPDGSSLRIRATEVLLLLTTNPLQPENWRLCDPSPDDVVAVMLQQQQQPEVLNVSNPLLPSSRPRRRCGDSDSDSKASHSRPPIRLRRCCRRKELLCRNPSRGRSAYLSLEGVC